jgi:hypothetical protein
MGFPDGAVQTYQLDESDRAVWFQPRLDGSWRRLGPEEILIHLNLKTAVAGWLERKLDCRAVRLAGAGSN